MKICCHSGVKFTLENIVYGARTNTIKYPETHWDRYSSVVHLNILFFFRLGVEKISSKNWRNKHANFDQTLVLLTTDQLTWINRLRAVRTYTFLRKKGGGAGRMKIKTDRKITLPRTVWRKGAGGGAHAFHAGNQIVATG